MKKVTIIGSGIAGLTCAIYTAQAGFKTTVITGNKYGGLLTEATSLTNFPGGATTGNCLITQTLAQAEKAGVEFIFDTVVDTNFTYEVKSVTLESGEVITSDYVVIATGSTPRRLDIPDAHKFEGKGIHYCAVCDGSLYNDKDIVGVVGGGESAFQEAIYLSNRCYAVHMYIRRDKPRACKRSVDVAESKGNIIIHYNTIIKSLSGNYNGFLNCVYINENGEDSERWCDGLFVAMGHVPYTRVFKEHSNITVLPDGYIPVDNVCSTSTYNVYAVGDCTTIPYKQAVIAAGMGATCAMDIIKKG